MKTIKLKDLPGENVQGCVAIVLGLCERLESEGAIDNELICSIMKIFENALDKKFQLWAMNENRTCSTYVKQQRIGLTPPISITCKRICQYAVNEYHSLVLKYLLQYIQTVQDPFSYFYLLAKVHMW